MQERKESKRRLILKGHFRRDTDPCDSPDFNKSKSLIRDQNRIWKPEPASVANWPRFGLQVLLFVYSLEPSCKENKLSWVGQLNGLV
jgi:hypothetical protein